MSDTIKNVRLKDKTGNILHPEITVDTELNSTSENPVQNKVINAKLDEVFQSVSNGKTLLETAITDKGSSVSKAGNVATFEELKTGIDNIKIMTKSIRSLGPWNIKPNNIITKLEGSTCCRFKNFIIVRQGLDNAKHYSELINVYDIKTGKCISHNPSRGPYYQTNKAYESSCLVNNKWYIFGGRESAAVTSITRVLTLNEKLTNLNNFPSYYSPTSGTNMPFGVCMATADYVNGNIYIHGGTGIDMVFKNYMQIFNVSTQTYTTLNCGTNKAGHASGVINGKIYYIGGISGDSSSCTNNQLVEEFDPLTKTITVKSTNSEFKAHCTAYGVINNELYIIGGAKQKSESSAYGTELSSVCVKYNPNTNTFTTLSSITNSKIGMASCVDGGNIYCIGGSNTYNTGGDNTTIRVYSSELEY